MVSAAVTNSCGGCKSVEGCGTASLARFFKQRQRPISAINRIGAKSGDVVVVGLNEAAMLRTAWVVYALPLLGLLLGGVIGHAIGSDRFAEPTAILTGLTGIVAGLFLSKRFGERMASNECYQPIVLRVLSVAGSDLGSGDIAVARGSGFTMEKP